MIAVQAQAQFKLVSGHRTYVKGEVFVREFPHRCPGVGCAISEWCRTHPQEPTSYRKTADPA